MVTITILVANDFNFSIYSIFNNFFFSVLIQYNLPSSIINQISYLFLNKGVEKRTQENCLLMSNTEPRNHIYLVLEFFISIDMGFFHYRHMYRALHSIFFFFFVFLFFLRQLLYVIVIIISIKRQFLFYPFNGNPIKWNIFANTSHNVA